MELRLSKTEVEKILSTMSYATIEDLLKQDYIPEWKVYCESSTPFILTKAAEE